MRYLPIFHPLIEADVAGAARYYEQRSVGLGRRFKQAFYRSVDAILSFPEMHAIKAGAAIRTKLLKPFPFLLVYAVEGDVVYVLSVQYAGKDPEDLKSILSERQSEK